MKADQYYCPKCNRMVDGSRIHREKTSMGWGYRYDYTCLDCGCQNGIMTRDERIDQICCPSPPLGVYIDKAAD